MGVFVCHCGVNIAGTVKVPEVIERLKGLAGVRVAADYQYCCSDPGQNIIREAIEREKLDRVVVACCSPTLHERTFRKACAAAGLNHYLCEIANIREQCSWVTKDKQQATEKAFDIIAMTVARVRQDESLEPLSVPVVKRALVVGAGIAGIQAALDIAGGGHEVVLVERQPSAGGHMAQLFETFPTQDLAQRILTPKLEECLSHPRIRFLSSAEVAEVSGHVGDFQVRIRQRPRYVDHEVCNGCGACIEVCPSSTKSEFERGLAERKAIYRLSPHALPGKPVIDPKTCVYLKAAHATSESDERDIRRHNRRERHESGQSEIGNRKSEIPCRACADACPVGAVRFDDKETIVEERVGAIVLATGFDLIDIGRLGVYGAGRVPDVIDGLAFERLLSASGPTSGELRRPSDGKVSKTVVFVQCAGSRDPLHGVPYCSKICCMYTAKNALVYKQRVPDGEAVVCYIDVRTPGKGSEEFYRQATESGVKYMRGKVSKLFRKGGKVIVWSADTLAGEKMEIAADMVVLATAMVPNRAGTELARQLKMQVDANGFLSEAHPKLKPVETLTGGYYLAGTCQGPKDVLETVVQASAAAAKVLALFGQDRLYREPTVAQVDEEVCVGCGVCERTCSYSAVKVDERRRVAVVEAALCEGCGACAVACPSGAMNHRNFSKKSTYEMVDAG